MIFSSPIFLLLFLPVVFLVNRFLKTKWSNIFLLLASLFFYAWGEPVFVLLMISSILVNWFCGLRIGHGSARKLWLALAVVFDLGMLGVFKYAGFFARILQNVFRSLAIPRIALPIGISFFTFQAISYVVDVYRGNTEASSSLINTALYISFFSQLIAGPIIKYKDINRQIERRFLSRTGTAVGFRRFIYGLAKKVLISNTLGLCADTVFAYQHTQIDPLAAWVGALTYAFQIYYDFSGYSDMAIGLGKMFGFDYPENFNYPYLSASVSEFWRRWHISLGSWFREYLYIPLGGNRKSNFRTYLNLAVVFLLTGLWHGADFSFVLWGAYHGFFTIVEHLGLKKPLEKCKPAGVLYCFLVVMFGWVLFRADNTSYALHYLLKMLLPWRYQPATIPYWYYLNHKTIFCFIAAVLGAGLLKKLPARLANRWRGSIPEAIWCVALLVLCIASLAGSTYNPFIYFQF